jgi:O-antigen ligase
MIYAICQYNRSGNTDSLYDDSLTVAIGRQSVYVAIAVNLALFTYVYLLQKRSFAIQYKGLVFLSIAFLVVFHYMLANRIAIISLYAGFLIFAIWHYRRAKKFLEGALLAVFLLAGAAAMIRFFPKTVSRFRELKHTSYSYTNGGHPGEHYDPVAPVADAWNGANFRLAVWKCGWQLFRQHPLAGLPLGDKQDQLMQVYKDRQFDFALQARLNMHNTYLDVLCNLGVFGLLVFLLGYLILPLVVSYKARDGLGLFIVLTFAVAMSTETWTDRSVGCIMLAFFLSLVSAWKRGPASNA